MNRFPILFLFAAAAAAIASAAEPFKALTACAAVPKLEVESALSRNVGRGVESGAGGESTCDYVGERGQVTITLRRLTTAVDLREEMDSLKSAVPGSAVRDAPAFERAFFLDIPGAGTQLYVISGEREFLLVSILGFGEAPQVAGAAEAMARRALARL